MIGHVTALLDPLSWAQGLEMKIVSEFNHSFNMNVLYCTLVLKQTNSLHWYVQLFRIQIGMSCMVQPGEGFSHIDLVYVYVPF